MRTRDVVDRRWWLAAFMACALAACNGDAESSRLTVTDSSGVTMSISPLGERRYAVVDTQPVLSLGGANAEAAQFFNVQGVHVDSAGNIWVANRGANDVRIFRPDGTPFHTVGRSGDGPGEFRAVRMLGSFPGRRVAFWDDRNPRLTIYRATAELDSVITARTDNGSALHAYGVFADGSLLIRIPRIVAADSLAPGQLLGDTLPLARFDHARAALTPVGNVEGVVWLWTGRQQVPIPFTIRAAFELDRADALHVATGSEFRVRVLSDGRHTETYGVDRDPRAVRDVDIDTYRQFHTEHMADGEARRAYLSALDHPSLPVWLPAYSQLVIDDRGNTWAQVYASNPLHAATWDVFAPNREWLGQVVMPAGLMVDVVTGNTIVGVWRDDVDVEHVRVYRFTIR